MVANGANVRAIVEDPLEPATPTVPDEGVENPGVKGAGGTTDEALE